MFTIIALTTAALAASDIAPTITLASSVTVDTAATHTVSVYNSGNQTANSVVLTIQLPDTNTSPQVYVMGTLSAYSSSCTKVGTTLSCNLGSIIKKKTKSVTFTLAVPQSSGSLDVVASVSTSSSQNSTGNDSTSAVIVPTYIDIPLTGPYTGVTLDHCTGTNLTAYFECRLFPSSISGFTADFDDLGNITIPQAPGYYGFWGQTTDDQLWFEIYDSNGSFEVAFEGNGTITGCFEGLTTFPSSNSSYVAPYEVCF